jgi:hypothetical protein
MNNITFLKTFVDDSVFGIVSWEDKQYIFELMSDRNWIKTPSPAEWKKVYYLIEVTKFMLIFLTFKAFLCRTFNKTMRVKRYGNIKGMFVITYGGDTILVSDYRRDKR